MVCAGFLLSEQDTSFKGESTVWGSRVLHPLEGQTVPCMCALNSSALQLSAPLLPSWAVAAPAEEGMKHQAPSPDFVIEFQPLTITDYSFHTVSFIATL